MPLASAGDIATDFLYHSQQFAFNEVQVGDSRLLTAGAHRHQLGGALDTGCIADDLLGRDPYHPRRRLGGDGIERHDGTVHPVEAAIFGSVADFAVPDMTIGNGAPHLVEKCFWVYR